MGFQHWVELAAQMLEAAGVAVILAGAVAVGGWTLWQAARARSWEGRFRQVRQGIGSAILLGLELLVGADIIRTVAEIPTLRKVAVLGIIVLIRTFLSFTLEVELEGRWPWQPRRR